MTTAGPPLPMGTVRANFASPRCRRSLRGFSACLVAPHAYVSVRWFGSGGTEVPSRRHKEHGCSRASCLALCLGSGQRPSWAWRQPGRVLQLATVRPHGGGLGCTHGCLCEPGFAVTDPGGRPQACCCACYALQFYAWNLWDQHYAGPAPLLHCRYTQPLPPHSRRSRVVYQSGASGVPCGILGGLIKRKNY